jgi:N-carbamoyl-L-amino-acid hydrolase
MHNINYKRLSDRLEKLALIGATPQGGCSRLAFTDADRQARDQVVDWMNSAGLSVQIDAIGNIFGTRPGRDPSALPIMTGSHIDTVVDGGKLDGNLGVLAGIEVVDTLNDLGVQTARPLSIAVFSNEEGVRFQPDMMGSLVHSGGASLEEVLSSRDRDGTNLGDALKACGYAGDLPPGAITPHAFVELHIEQGPVLDSSGVSLGAVADLQGISWTEIALTGEANHAGTTPMSLRKDAGHGAARIIVGARHIAEQLGGTQVATCGAVSLTPNLINVVASSAVFTVDLRNTDDDRLSEAETRLEALIETVARDEGLTAKTRRLVRFNPVRFDIGLVESIENHARYRNLSCKRMTSGAGHDAQMMSRICPTAMIFTPSIEGISHNPAEATMPRHLEAGANVLLDTMLDLASS